MSWMLYKIRYGWPRKYILRFTRWKWPHDAPEWILDFLYPPDLMVKFEDSDGL